MVLILKLNSFLHIPSVHKRSSVAFLIASAPANVVTSLESALELPPVGVAKVGQQGGIQILKNFTLLLNHSNPPIL